MLLKRKSILCTDCGFLCWRFSLDDDPGRIGECIPYWRKQIQTDKDLGTQLGTLEDPVTGEYVTVTCIRLQWIYAPHIKDSTRNYVDLDALIQKRKCPYYIDYEPGFGPEEHKELKREADTRRTIFKATLIGGAIGATAAIVAQILYFLFAASP